MEDVIRKSEGCGCEGVRMEDVIRKSEVCEGVSL